MRRLILLVLSALLLSACDGPAPTVTTVTYPASPVASAAQSAAAGKTPVKIALGYIPDVQFAPFYVAQAKGYYAAEGLAVTIDNSFIQDALPQVAQGRLTFANAAGDEILVARAQQLPIKMVFQTYQQYPVALFSKQSQGIAKPADLKGKTIGVPGRYGATYIGLKGLLYAQKMSEQDVNITEIGFTQAAAVREDKVPVAVGYFNNEPVVLQSDGVPVNVIRVADYIALVSNGIVASESFIKDHPDVVKAFARATARGLQDTLDKPDEAFKLSLQFIPELKPDRQPQELLKLKQALALWRSPATDANGLGYSEPKMWETTHRFLRDSGILPRDVNIQQAFTNDLRK